MLPQTEQDVFGQTGRRKRFDAEEARRILERAVAEQTRRDRELAGSYSLEELEEMAAEAGISPEALRAAIKGRPRRRAGLPRRNPKRSLPFGSGTVIAGLSGIVLVAMLLAFPEMAYALIFALLLLLILVMFAG